MLPSIIYYAETRFFWLRDLNSACIPNSTFLQQFPACCSIYYKYFKMCPAYKLYWRTNIYV